MPSEERLVSCAIARNGVLYSGGRSHYQLRCELLDEQPGKGKRDDIEGFMTSNGTFLTREEAVKVGVEAGQLHERWLTSQRALLSSDINW